MDALRHQRDDPDWQIPGRVLPEDQSFAVVDPAATVATARVVGGVDLGRLDRLAPGQLAQVDIGEATYVLCRPDDGGYVLLDGLCTHSQTHLAGGLLVDGCIECPKHNGRFDLRTGEPMRGRSRCRCARTPSPRSTVGSSRTCPSTCAPTNGGHTSTGRPSRTDRHAAIPTASGARPSAAETGEGPPDLA